MRRRAKPSSVPWRATQGTPRRTTCSAPRCTSNRSLALLHRQEYQQSIAQQPQDVEALLRLAILAERQKQPQQALTAYRAIVAQQPDNIEAQYRLAVLYDTQGDTKQAMSAYARVLTLQPTHAEAVL